jgi:predicted DsbA family dithiol-disulfide isomerase
MEMDKQKKQEQKNNTASDIADRVEITYYTDPLCCWSWGFEPQWRKLRYQYEGKLNWRYVMAGLLPSWANFHDGLNAVTRPAQMGPVWMEATHLTGMPIDTSLWIKKPPVSSYPACIAVKAASLQSALAEEVYLRKLREAVMLNGKDISDVEVLQSIAKEVAALIPEFDAKSFQQQITSEGVLQAFRKDVNETKAQGIKRFPALLFRKTGYPALLVTGYRPYSVLQDIMTKFEVTPTQQNVHKEEYTRYWGSLTERELQEAVPVATNATQ